MQKLANKSKTTMLLAILRDVKSFSPVLHFIAPDRPPNYARRHVVYFLTYDRSNLFQENLINDTPVTRDIKRNDSI